LRFTVFANPNGSYIIESEKYPHRSAMLTSQNRRSGLLPASLRLVGAPALQCCSATNFWTIYKDMRKLDSGPGSKIIERQANNLAAVLRHAATSVPFWQKQFNDLGIEPTELEADMALDCLRRLPILTKDTIKKGFPREFTSQGTKDEWRYETSAGTTEARMTVITDFRRRDFSRALIYRSRNRIVGEDFSVPIAEVPPHACNVVCGLVDDGPENLMNYAWWAIRKGRLFREGTLSELRGRFERQILTRGLTLMPLEAVPWEKLVPIIDERLEKIQSHQPLMIGGLPLFLMWMARRAEELGLEFSNLKAVIPFGALTTPAMADRISRGLGAPFVDVYGTGEVGHVACGVDQSRGMVGFEDVMHVDIVDDDGEPVPPGESGQIVLTDLINRAMPILRYRVGDSGRFLPDTSDGGRMRLEVEGRMQETFNLEGRKVYPRATLDLVFSIPEILNFRLDEHRPGCFRMAVMHDGEVDFKSLGERIQALMQCENPPEFQSVPFVSPASSGKFCNCHPYQPEVDLL